jgi:hypothetical protein
VQVYGFKLGLIARFGLAKAGAADALLATVKDHASCLAAVTWEQQRPGHRYTQT